MMRDNRYLKSPLRFDVFRFVIDLTGTETDTQRISMIDASDKWLI